MVRQAIDAINRGDIRWVMEQQADDDFEMDWSNSIGPLNGVYRGRGQVSEVWESFLEAWDELQWDVQDVIDLDTQRVLVVNRVRMRGRASRVDVEATGAQIWTIRNATLGSVKLYQSKAEALEAVGLSE